MSVVLFIGRFPDWRQNFKSLRIASTNMTTSNGDTGSVQVKFTTKDASLSIDAQPLLVPSSLKRYGLSEIVNHLLESETQVPFSFLIGGELLSTSVDAFLTRKGLSTESVLEIEYIRSILPPSFLVAYPHDDWVSAISLGEDIITGSYDSLVRVWDQSQNCIATHAGHSAAIKSVCRGEYIVSSSMDRTLRVWKDECVELRGHTASVESCDILNNGVVSGSADGVLGIWSITDEHTITQNKRKRIKTSSIGPRHLHKLHTGQIGQVKYIDSSTVYSVGWDHSLVTTDLNTLQPLSQTQTASPLFSLLPIQNAVLTGGQRTIELHDLRSSAITKLAFLGHTSFISSLTAAPNSDYLFASSSFDGDVRVWDIRNEHSLYTIKREKEVGTKVLSAGWSNIGIVSGGEDCQLQINRGVE